MEKPPGAPKQTARSGKQGSNTRVRLNDYEKKLLCKQYRATGASGKQLADWCAVKLKKPLSRTAVPGILKEIDRWLAVPDGSKRKSSKGPMYPAVDC